MSDTNKKLSELTKSISKILYDYDPAGLKATSVPKDEYAPEAEAIIRQLGDIEDIKTLQWMVYDVLKCYFFKENILVSSDERYKFIAAEIWDVWHEVLK